MRRQVMFFQAQGKRSILQDSIEVGPNAGGTKRLGRFLVIRRWAFRKYHRGRWAGSRITDYRCLYDKLPYATSLHEIRMHAWFISGVEHVIYHSLGLFSIGFQVINGSTKLARRSHVLAYY